jgi:uncharacterized protein (DUF885 family)
MLQKSSNYLYAALFTCLMLTIPFDLAAQSSTLDTIKSQIATDWPSLNPQLSYEANLAAVPELPQLKQRLAYFIQLEKSLQKVDTTTLDQAEQLDFQIIHFEVCLELEYLSLALAFKNNPSQDVNSDGLTHQFAGKYWYRYYVKKWTGTRMTPDELFELGLEEIYQVKAEIKSIQAATGMDSLAFYQYLNADVFFLKDEKTLTSLFTEREQRIRENLSKAYPTDWSIPALNISRGTNRDLASAPGYYNNNTFYYNRFDFPFNLRQLDWLLMHEGNPGHHFQGSYASQLDLPAYRNQFFNAGFQEGWAAYTEYYGEDIGLYQTPYDYLGKWEWDIVRSVRVPLDVGINYYGWNNETALAFWKQHIPNQDQIAQREIDRMRRWPAQVHTYKVGAAIIQQLRQQEQKKLDADFDIVAFHKKILDQGRIPVGLLPMVF